MKIIDLEKKALQIRRDIIQLIYESGTGHTGSDLSCTDILVALYYDILNVDPKRPNWSDRDRYVQSKGHAVEALWTVLADKGFFPKSELKTFSKFKTRLIGHPNNKVEGIEMNTGSLGHGLSLSVGMAISAKMDKKKYRIYTLMGDGEQAEGSVWEAAMAAAHYNLDNLVAILDNNGLQITGNISNVMNSNPLKEKYESFGWNVLEIDGNNMSEIVRALKEGHIEGKPTIIIAHTVKGKGVSMAENKANWHHHVPSKEEYEIAINDLQNKIDGVN